ncbi:MAG: UDP-N-acetylmuramoyl-tripeptide--D-alanyl-D-alanine ligase [Epsilonproteobacteria bacterium]|nr:UDP-N-acetylmuramoyl-tripeptide--D-alanyl-D-alanine ligase [Campylobacterota bacterium]
MEYLDYVVNFLTTMAVGFYLITVLQWYNYKLDRVVFKFSKYNWHILYFVLPIATYYLANKFYWIYLFFGLLPALFIWYKKLDKPLVLTDRVKRYFALLVFLSLVGYVLDYYFHTKHGIFLPILLSVIGSEIIERIIFNNYKKQAKAKLEKINPTIIAITASYGKTSIKNFLYQLLQEKYNTYKTPKSVNTLKGIVADINNNLPQNTDIYIVEAGARQKGDIDEIAQFIQHQYAIIGKIGPQHIEYFKTIDNIINTKREILNSPNLIKAISYDLEDTLRIKDYIHNIQATLEDTQWDLTYKDRIIHLITPILGSFNAINISLAFYMAKEFGLDDAYLVRKIAKLSPIPHRLQKVQTNGKVIIDDSFNGNIEGMLEAIELVKDFGGRKFIVTPGLVEANETLNKKLAKKINDVFDVVIVTGSLNRRVLCENISRPNKIYLGDKSKLEKILADNTKAGDLILFCNDAPNFI